MARVLYTSVHGGGRPRPGFIEATGLVEARKSLLAQGHRRIRFWSHPAMGDARGSTPEGSLRSVPRPPWGPFLLATALLLALLPGAWIDYASFVGVQWGFASLLGSVSFTLLLFALIPAFARLREQLQYSEPERATILLWLMWLSAPPVGFLFIPWWLSIRAHRLRDQPDAADRALRPLRWLPHVGLHRPWRFLRGQVLATLDMHDERITLMRAHLAAEPDHVVTRIDLAMWLALFGGRPEEAADVLGPIAHRVLPPVQASVRAYVSALLALERGEPHLAATGIESARTLMQRGAGTLGSGWGLLFDLAAARAQALDGRGDAARSLFTRALPSALWGGGMEAVLDRTAEDVFRAPT
jgi:hypothetical protein